MTSKASLTPEAAASASALLADARVGVDAILARWADRLERMIGGRQGDAVGYALRTPGKRVRAALLTASYHAAGGCSSAIAGVAAAVETVHAYSLVHDDLPCMDDDDLRRGRPTVHRAFDVPLATRAGFYLVPASALVLVEAADELELEPPVLGRMADVLFTAGGIQGMVGGQWLDLEAEHRGLTRDELTAVHSGKTGALIRAACMLGGLAARADEASVAALAAYGDDVGLAFQVADDVLDATGTSASLGKTAGRDQALDKSTYVGLLGIDGARAEAERLARRAASHLERAGLASAALAALAGYIASRKS